VATSQEDEVSDSPATLSPDGLGARQDILYETAAAANRLAAEDYAGGRRSIRDIPRKQLGIQSPAPPSLDEALRSSSSLFTGVVVDQVFETVPDEVTGRSRSFVVSVLRDDAGNSKRVSQPGGIVIDTAGAPVISYVGECGEPLEFDTTYAVLLIDEAAREVVAVGHAYVVDSGMLISTCELGGKELHEKPLSELMARFGALKSS
jgi:hypothetical protein